MNDSYLIDFSIANSEQIEAALCQRLEQIRLTKNTTQAQLAAEAGVSLRTIQRMEKGAGVSLDTFIRVVSALGIVENLEALLPDPTVRPMDRISTARRVDRQRARSRKADTGVGWTWGDEKDEQE